MTGITSASKQPDLGIAFNLKVRVSSDQQSFENVLRNSNGNLPRWVKQDDPGSRG